MYTYYSRVVPIIALPPQHAVAISMALALVGFPSSPCVSPMIEPERI